MTTVTRFRAACGALLGFGSLKRPALAGTIAVGLAVAAGEHAPAQSSSDLAAIAQNPVAAAYSLPIQNNIAGGVGRKDSTANVLNIQPVLPFSLSSDWNLISRTIAPLIYTPGLVDGLPEFDNAPVGHGSNFGLGDINETLFLSPTRPGSIIWGVGPSVTVPTATNRELGTGKLSIGPSAVVFTMPTPWAFGLLARQLWSVAGDDNRKSVSQLLLQPFVTYNLSRG